VLCEHVVDDDCVAERGVAACMASMLQSLVS